MATTFQDFEQSLTESDIASVERQIGVEFPDELKAHYIRFNGGSPDPYCFLTDDDRWLIVQEFLAVKYGSNTLEYTYQTLTTSEQPVPEYMIPFAVEAGGNYFCISSESEGGIYYYDGEHYDDTQKAFTKLADTLTEFINQLQEEPDAF